MHNRVEAFLSESMPSLVAVVFDVLHRAHCCACLLRELDDLVSILGSWVTGGRDQQNTSRCEAGHQIRNVVTRCKSGNYFRHLDSNLVCHFVLIRAGGTARTRKAKAFIQGTMK